MTSSSSLLAVSLLAFRALVLSVIIVVALLITPIPLTRVSASFVETIVRTEPKMVKIYGAGGIRGLEAYQSGFLISSAGHVLTSWSYVLDTEPVIVTLSDGSRHEARLVGADPRLEIAVLKIPETVTDFFDLSESVTVSVGDPVLAFSNLYGIAVGNEPNSVLQGTVSSVTRLSARRGTYKTPYTGQVYVIDAVTNNSGASGGALTDRHGRLCGILGKELRSDDTNVWLNYAVPIFEIRDAVLSILEGRSLPDSASDDQAESAKSPWTLPKLGLRLVPNVLPITPAYVESTIPGSYADQAGMQPDDLILYVDSYLVRSHADVVTRLARMESFQPMRIVVLRAQQLVEITIEAED